MMRYAIHEGNMNRVEKHMNKIQRKCNKYGCDFHYDIVGEEYRDFVVDTDDEGNKLDRPVTVTRRFVIIEVDGKAIINDWTFVGTVEHTENGNIITKVIDIEVPSDYYTTSPICEHCGTRRARKNTYIVYNENTGEFKQVGKSCLNEFTQGVDAEWIASYYSLFNDIATFEAPVEGCGFGERYFNTVDILAYTSAVTKIFGYVSASYGNSTSTKVKDFYQVSHGSTGLREVDEAIKREMDEVNFNVDDTDYDVAENIIKYIDSIDETNNYIHNIKVICKNDRVVYHNINLLVSAITCYQRDIERKEQEAKRVAEASKSDYVANVGDKVEIEIANWKCLTSFESCFDGYNVTTTYMYQFTDNDGNILIWRTSKYIDEDEQITSIKGTVKEHKEYRGTKQTILTRCKVK